MRIFGKKSTFKDFTQIAVPNFLSHPKSNKNPGFGKSIAYTLNGAFQGFFFDTFPANAYNIIAGKLS